MTELRTEAAPDGLVAKLDTLTGLRFVAALVVFCAHVRLFASEEAQGVFFAMFVNVGLAVSFFFVLSGFVLTVAAKPGDTPGKFYRRRFWRVYPNHIVVLAIVFLGFKGLSETPASELITSVLMVQPWAPEVDIMFGGNLPAWTLGCDVLFYALFPALLPMVRKIPAERLWAWAVALIVVVIGLAFVAQALPAEPASPLTGEAGVYPTWFGLMFPPVRFAEFLLGMVMARILMTGRWPRLGMGPIVALLLAAFVGAIYAPPVLTFTAIGIIPVALIVPATALANMRGKGKFLSSRVMVRLGELSYAFYLLHVVMIGVTIMVVGEQVFSLPVALLLLVAQIVATVAASWILNVAVEKPCMRLFSRSRRSSPGPKPEPVAEPAPNPVG